ncbi:hypothetical protein K1719_014727 [Acacia pycnantha]|nr:hypothetical protein K1719_014727 [Acacia pycnantha]
MGDALYRSRPTCVSGLFLLFFFEVLKETLIRHGFTFESETDTEVIPKLAKNRPVKCFQAQNSAIRAIVNTCNPIYIVFELSEQVEDSNLKLAITFAELFNKMKPSDLASLLLDPSDTVKLSIPRALSFFVRSLSVFSSTAFHRQTAALNHCPLI